MFEKLCKYLYNENMSTDYADDPSGDVIWINPGEEVDFRFPKIGQLDPLPALGDQRRVEHLYHVQRRYMFRTIMTTKFSTNEKGFITDYRRKWDQSFIYDHERHAYIDRRWRYDPHYNF